MTSGSALGHTTSNSRCSRCNTNLTKPFSITIEKLEGYRSFDITLAKGKYSITVTAGKGGDWQVGITNEGIIAMGYGEATETKTFTVRENINNGTLSIANATYSKVSTITVTITPLD